MSLIKVVCYVLRVKNMNSVSPSDPSGTAAAEAKPRCVYLILKRNGQSSRCQVRLLPPRRSRGAYTQFQNHMVRVSSLLQSWSKAVVCVSTPRMYPCSFFITIKIDCIQYIFVFTRKYPLRRYILGVLMHTTALDQLWGGDETLTMWF